MDSIKSTEKRPPTSINLLPGVDIIINGRFKLLAKIGNGAFGVVFKGQDMENNNTLVALKLEQSSHNKSRSMLDNEYKFYRKLDGGPGIPKVYWFGLWETSKPQEIYFVLAMELLGKSLQKLVSLTWYGMLKLRTVLMLGDQILEILEFMHTHFVVHRDIKPGNLVMGTGKNCDKVYLIDFGLATSCALYSPSESNCKKHIFNKKHQLNQVAQMINGSLKYCSINAHYGRTLSRRDDIECLGYMLMLLLNGSLPWSAYANKIRPDNAIKTVLDMKLAFEPSKDIDCHEVLCAFLSMAQKLAFEETPNYNEWRAKFQEVYSRLTLPGQISLDWDDSAFLDESSACELTSTSKSEHVSVVV